MKLRGRWRRRAKWSSGCTLLVLGAAWLASARWTLWYAWRAEILMPYDSRVVGLGAGGVFYKAFHPTEMSDYFLADPGWHGVHAPWRWGLKPLAIMTRQFRTELWLPIWPALAVVAPLTALIWLWPTRVPRGHCRRCGYNLTGNVSGRCPECEAAVPQERVA